MPHAPSVSALRLGFGCSGAWGMRWFSEREATALVAMAVEGGVRHFDTAGFYGGGEAERRLGAALSALREPVFVSTKTGTRRRRGRTYKDFSPVAIRADVEASLKRLGRERLDLLYLHGPSSAELAMALPTLATLKDAGKIERWGVCGQGEGLEEGLGAGAQVLMGAYNLFRRQHAHVFRRAKARRVGVVAIAPLGQGLYARNFFAPRSAADLWRIARALRNREELWRARAARTLLESVEGWSPAQLALAFTLANPDIDVALTTTTKTAHLGESLAAAARPPPAGFLERLDALRGGA